MADPTGYQWDTSAGVYRTAAGDAVPIQSVHNALMDAMEGAGARMGDISGRLAGGSATVAEWHSAMASELTTMHTTATALANGGWAQTDSAAWKRAESVIADQLRFLRGFANDVANGTEPVDGGRFMLRASMYASSGHATFENERAQEREGAGAQWERWMIDSGAESCDDCLSLADEGWVPIGTLPDLGSNQCLTNCRCWIDYETSDEMPEND